MQLFSPITPVSPSTISRVENTGQNNHAHVLDGFSDGRLRYVEIFVNAIDLKPYATGTAQPKLNQAKMNSIPVALPPLAITLR
jgi:type I restriction enzyme S subunit